MGAKIRDKRFRVQGTRFKTSERIQILWSPCFLSLLPCMDFLSEGISLESVAMTNEEILHADLLDILFEKRRKVVLVRFMVDADGTISKTEAFKVMPILP